jgi:cytidylate kinase
MRREDLSRLFPGLRKHLSGVVIVLQLAPVIAIDGPAASGKGTVAQGVARALAFNYLDSGALYRLVALAALQKGLDLGDADALGALARALPAEFDDARILLDGKPVQAEIRTEPVSAAASRVAVHAQVREALFERQRAFRSPPGLVAEGRDMGTVVFPDARLKVFLTASAEARAERRYKQLMEKGLSATIETLLREIQERDARDRSRASAPLAPAADAVVLDTTQLTVEQVVSQVLELWRDLA